MTLDRVGDYLYSYIYILIDKPCEYVDCKYNNTFDVSVVATESKMKENEGRRRKKPPF